MPDQEVSIVIKAKNFTADEFSNLRTQIAGLKGKTEEAKKSGDSWTETMLGAKSAGALWNDQVKSIVSGFSIASLLEKATGALFEWTANIYANASALVAQSNRTGVSIEWLQRWQNVAEKANISQDAFTGASINLGRVLEGIARGGGGDALDALADLGLSFEALKGKTPEQKLDLVIRSLANMTDVERRNYDGKVLLGKKFDEISLSLADYDREVQRNINLSDDQARSLNEQREAVEDLQRSLAGLLTGTLGGVALAWRGMTEGVGTFAKNAFDLGIPMAMQLASSTGRAAMAAKELTAADKDVIAVMVQNGHSAQEIATLYGRAGEAAGNYAKTLKTTEAHSRDFTRELSDAKLKLKDLSVETRGQIESALALGMSQDDIATKVGVAKSVIGLYKDQLAKEKQASDEATRATSEHKRAVQALADQFAGRKLANEIALTAQAYLQAGGAAGTSKGEIDGLVKKIGDYVDKGGAVPPMLLDFYRSHQKFNAEIDVTYAGLQKIIKAAPEAGFAIKKFIEPLEEIKPVPIEQILNFGGDTSKKVMKQSEEIGLYAKYGFEAGLKGTFEVAVSKAVSEAAASQTLTGSIAAFGRSIATDIGADIATHAKGPFGKGLGQALQLAAKQPSFTAAIAAFAGEMGATIGGQLGFAMGGPLGRSIGSMLGSVVGPIINKFFGTAGRDAVKQFAESQGGFDALHAEMLRVFDAPTAERYWKMLTQGVGRNNPQQAQQVIQQITTAMDQARQATEAAGEAAKAAAEAQAAAFSEAQQKIGGALAAVTAGEIRSQEEFDRLARIGLNTFNTLVASGVAPRDAMEQVGGSVDALTAALETSGLKGSAAYDELAKFRTLTDKNRPLLDQVAGLNDLMQMTTTLGGMNAETFADMQAQGLSAYEQLRAAGFTEAQAREQLKPLLQEEIRLNKEKGYAIDEATQKIIAQGLANGDLAVEAESLTDVLMEGLSALILAVGGELPAAWTAAVQATKDGAAASAAAVETSFAAQVAQSAQAVRDELGGVFEDLGKGVTIPVDFSVNRDGLDGGSNGVQAYAVGGIAEGRQVAMLAERGRREIVGSESFMATALSGAIARLGGGVVTPAAPGAATGSAPAGDIHIVIDQAGARTVTRSMWEDIKRRVAGGELLVPASSLVRRPT